MKGRGWVKREGGVGASYLTRFRASRAAVTHASFGRDCQLVFSCYLQTTAADHWICFSHFGALLY